MFPSLLNRWVNRRISSDRRRARRGKSRDRGTARLRFEHLEDRQLLSVMGLITSPDGQHQAWVEHTAGFNQPWYVYKDSAMVGGPYAGSAGDLKFSPNSQHLAWTANTNGGGGGTGVLAWVIGLDGVNFGPYWETKNSYFTSNSQFLHYEEHGSLVDPWHGHDVSLVNLSKTTLTASSTSSSYGQVVTYTATVDGLQSGTPSGLVTLNVDGRACQSATLDESAKATFTLNSLNAGAHTIVAAYQGAVHFKPSQSPSMAVTVQPARTTTAVTASPSTTAFGQLVTFQAIVNPVPPGFGVPGGSVTFAIDGQSTASVPLSAGIASLQLNNLTAGIHTVTATYGDNGNYLGSQGSAVETVNLAVKPATLPEDTAGMNYSATFAAAGGSGSYGYTLASGALPAGLTLSGAGVLSGVTTVAGTYSFTVKATDKVRTGITGSQPYTLIVRPDVPARLAVGAPGRAEAGTAFAVTVTAQDQYGNTTPSVAGVATLTASDGQTVTPASITLAGGIGKASVTLKVAGTLTLTAQGAGLQGTSGQIVVNVNDPPSGADKTIVMLEDKPYVIQPADFGFTDPADNPANAFKAVKITTLPTAGSLKFAGYPAAVGASIPVANLTLGQLTFTPVANASGSPYASFTFQVQDNGGTACGGKDLDPTPNKLTFNVTPVNDAPSGTSKTLTILEDQAYPLTVADFGLTDTADMPANTLSRVKITTVPLAGSLKLSGVAVAAGQFVTAADLAAGNLQFTPAANANGTPYAGFTFQVEDNGGTADGGINLDPTPEKLTFNVTAVNDAPSGTDKTITILEDRPYALKAADLGFTDALDRPANVLSGVKITTLPSAGSLKLSGVEVAAGQTVPAASVPNLQFIPAANANGSPYTGFTFQVKDTGGTANGGIDLDPTPNTITFNVTPVNDAPSGADKTIGLLKNTSYTIAVADFGFSDPNDSPANQFARVRIAGLPAAGSLKLSGAPVSLWQFIKVSDISAGKLMFTPAANATGSPYAKVLFQVEDDGGTANGGLNLDATSNALTFNVTAAPAPAASLLAACALPEQSPRANKGLDRYHDLALATAVWN